MARDDDYHSFLQDNRNSYSSTRSTMSILSFLLVSILLPSTLSSHHHHNQNPNTPSPSTSPSTDTSSNIPLPILLACNATRYPSICHSTLLTNTSLPANPAPNDLISTTLTTISSYLSTSLTTAHSILSSASSNPNLTNAASNCVTFLTLSTHRLATPTSTSLSATLLHQYDCWSAYKYVNSSSAISNAMAFLNNSIAVTSNALSMLSSLQCYGDDTARWAPPETERDGFWPNLSGSATGSGVDRLGVPTKLSINVTVCKESCQLLRLQDAVDAAPDYGKEWFVVYVKEGVYEETVRVPWEKANLVVVGDGIGKTVVTGSLHADRVGVSTFNTATVGTYL